ncbi:MAG TPA: PilZ domain-containing protein [Verrucomicrobiae bacterium]|nr:PilZ domain-containing protein [Verrucomicrobiae bacterium]
MPTSERRSAPRFTMRIPIELRLGQTQSSDEIQAETVNISRCGIYFSTEKALERNSIVKILMKLPREVTLGYAKKCLVTGRVVHVQPRGEDPGKSGIGVHFLYYELAETPAPPERSEEWKARLRASA